VTVATAKADTEDVATASEDVENVGTEVNTVVAAAAAVVAKVEKVQLSSSVMRMPSHLSAAGRSNRNTSFKKRWKEAMSGRWPFVKCNSHG
jgi:murein L,D-transpeptidase YafK